jgi:hypothetical protein
MRMFFLIFKKGQKKDKKRTKKGQKKDKKRTKKDKKRTKKGQRFKKIIYNILY